MEHFVGGARYSRAVYGCRVGVCLSGVGLSGEGRMIVQFFVVRNGSVEVICRIHRSKCKSGSGGLVVDGPRNGILVETDVTSSTGGQLWRTETGIGRTLDGVFDDFRRFDHLLKDGNGRTVVFFLRGFRGQARVILLVGNGAVGE